MVRFLSASHGKGQLVEKYAIFIPNIYPPLSQYIQKESKRNVTVW
jgi:hypothetical protein